MTVTECDVYSVSVFFFNEGYVRKKKKKIGNPDSEIFDNDVKLHFI